jgi:hypothetical protein
MEGNWVHFLGERWIVVCGNPRAQADPAAGTADNG